MKPEDEKTQTEKLEEEIALLQTKIKNTEYDLKHMFKGNEIIEQKLHNTKKLLQEKKQLIQELQPDNKIAKKIKDLEEDLIKKDKISISKEQEHIIDEEVETEFL